MAKIKRGSKERVELGNLKVQHDWEHAMGYVDAIWRISQQDEPDDYDISTGRFHSVCDFCSIAFNHVGLDYRDLVDLNQQFYRNQTIVLQVYSLETDEELDWRLCIPLPDLVCEMVKNDLRLLGT